MTLHPGYFFTAMFSLLSTPIMASGIFDPFYDKVYEDPQRIVFKASPEVKHFKAMLKRVLPADVQKITFEKKFASADEIRLQFVPSNNMVISTAEIHRVYAAENIEEDVAIFMFHQDFNLSGLGVVKPKCAVELNSATLSPKPSVTPFYDISKTGFLLRPEHSYIELERIKKFICKNIPENKLSGLRISVASKFISYHYLDVCHWFKNHNLKITSAFFPKLAIVKWPHYEKIFFDPNHHFCDDKGKITVLRPSRRQMLPKRIALDSLKGVLIRDYDFVFLSSDANFEKKLIEIPSSLPKKGTPVPEVQNSNSKAYYNPKIVKKAQRDLEQQFPTLIPVKFDEFDPTWAAVKIIKRIETKKFKMSALKDQPQIYFVDILRENIVVGMFNPEYKLMALYNSSQNQLNFNNDQGEVIKVRRADVDFDPLEKILKYFDCKLPETYKQNTQIMLISSFLSPGFESFITYFSNRNFFNIHVHYYPCYQDLDNTIHLDSAEIYFKKEFFNVSNGQEISFPCRIALHSSGKVMKNFIWGIRFK